MENMKSIGYVYMDQTIQSDLDYSKEFDIKIGNLPDILVHLATNSIKIIILFYHQENGTARTAQR